MTRRFLSTLLAACLLAAAIPAAAQAPPRNIVLIYADDLGYGDVSAYGATHLATPNIDRLAREGVRFTDGPAPAATCTPSRYSLLTGEYAWRRPGGGGLPGGARGVGDPGRALGEPPNTQTADPLVDAYLWIKSPGESDGTCKDGPAAGVWWPEYALGLAQRAK